MFLIEDDETSEQDGRWEGTQDLVTAVIARESASNPGSTFGISTYTSAVQARTSGFVSATAATAVLGGLSPQGDDDEVNTNGAVISLVESLNAIEFGTNAVRVIVIISDSPAIDTGFREAAQVALGATAGVPTHVVSVSTFDSMASEHLQRFVDVNPGGVFLEVDPEAFAAVETVHNAITEACSIEVFGMSLCICRFNLTILKQVIACAQQEIVLWTCTSWSMDPRALSPQTLNLCGCSCRTLQAQF